MWTRPGKGILQSAQSKERIRLQVRRLIATVQFRVSNYHPAKDQGAPNRMAYLYEREVRSYVKTGIDLGSLIGIRSEADKEITCSPPLTVRFMP